MPKLHGQALKLASQLRQGAACDAHYMALAENLGCDLWTSDLQDRDGIRRVLARRRNRCPRLQCLWADVDYAGPTLGDWVKKRTPWDLAIVRRSEPNSGFQVLPRCWVVERTFTWLGPVAFQARRFSKSTRCCRKPPKPGATLP